MLKPREPPSRRRTTAKLLVALSYGHTEERHVEKCSRLLGTLQHWLTFRVPDTACSSFLVFIVNLMFFTILYQNTDEEIAFHFRNVYVIHLLPGVAKHKQVKQKAKIFGGFLCLLDANWAEVIWHSAKSLASGTFRNHAMSTGFLSFYCIFWGGGGSLLWHSKIVSFLFCRYNVYPISECESITLFSVPFRKHDPVFTLLKSHANTVAKRLR